MSPNSVICLIIHNFFNLITVLNKFPYYKSLKLNLRDCTVQLILTQYVPEYVQMNTKIHVYAQYCTSELHVRVYNVCSDTITCVRITNNLSHVIFSQIINTLYYVYNASD